MLAIYRQPRSATILQMCVVFLLVGNILLFLYGSQTRSHFNCKNGVFVLPDITILFCLFCSCYTLFSFHVFLFYIHVPFCKRVPQKVSDVIIKLEVLFIISSFTSETTKLQHTNLQSNNKCNCSYQQVHAVLHKKYLFSLIEDVRLL